jgi:hypothetical protein
VYNKYIDRDKESAEAKRIRSSKASDASDKENHTMAVQMQQGTIENPIVLDFKDGRKKVRTLKISGFVKPSGRVVAKVTNDKGVEYFVDGDECRNCPSHGKCYHRQAVAQVAHLLPKYDELVSEEPEPMSGYDVIAEACQVAANAEAQLDAAMYDELGATKKVSVPASGGDDWDYCEGCQCRVKKGQRRCPNC